MKRLTIAALVLVLVFSACSGPNYAATEVGSETRVEDPMVQEFYQYYLEKYEDSIYDSRELSSGGLLLVKNAELEPGQRLSVFDAEELHYFLSRLEVWVENGKPQVNTESIQWADEWPDRDLGKEPVWIFYEPQAEVLEEDNGSDSDNTVYYDSHFFLLDGEQGRDVVIVVTPPMSRQLSAYSESSWYGITPFDSLDTVPMKVSDERTGLHSTELWHFGYPVWIFVVPEKDINETYELRYGDYVLTGTDILAGVWYNNGLPAQSRPEQRKYNFFDQ